MNTISNNVQQGFLGESYISWFLFLLFFVFAWAAVTSFQAHVGGGRGL